MHRPPSSDEVQQLISEWKSYMEESIVCEAEMLHVLQIRINLIIDSKVISINLAMKT